MCGVVLLRLAYLSVMNAFALRRLLPRNDRDMDTEILALRHQLAVLQRQLAGPKVPFQPADRALLASLLQRPLESKIKARGHFPNEQAALKCLYLVTRSLDAAGTGRTRWTMRWKPAMNALSTLTSVQRRNSVRASRSTSAQCGPRISPFRSPVQCLIAAAVTGCREAIAQDRWPLRSPVTGRLLGGRR